MGDWDSENPFEWQPTRQPQGDGGGLGGPPVPGQQGAPFEPPPTRSFGQADGPLEPPGQLMDEEPLPAPRVVEQPVRRARSGRPARANNRALWAFAIAGFAVGILLGLGLLAWQRVAMLADKRALQDTLRSVETSATASQEQVASLQARLSQVEASMTALVEQNTKLTSELANANAALSAANAKLDEAAKTLTITERSVSPASVVKEAPLTLEVKVKGKADKVSMKLLGLAPVSYTKVYNLAKVSTSAGVETWRRSVTAPPTVGTYRYYATAYIGTKSFEMPGVSAWTFEVKAGP